MMTTASFQHHPGGGMPPGMHVQGMGPGGPNPNQGMGQPMHMMPGVGPNGPHVGHGGPVMGGMQPGMGGGMHGQPNAASMAQAHLNPQQQQQVLQQQAAAQAYQMQQHRMRAQQMAAAQQQLQQQGHPNGMPMGFPGGQTNFTPQQIAQMQQMQQMRQMHAAQQAGAGGVPPHVNLPPHLMQQQAQLQQQQQHQQQQAAHAHAQQQHQQQQQQLQQQMQQAMQQSGQQGGNPGPPVSQPQQGPQPQTQQGPMRPPSQMSNAREAQPSPAPPATPQQPQPQSQPQPMQGQPQAQTPNPQQQQPQPPQPGNPQQQIGQGPQPQNPQAQATAQQPNAQLRTQMQLAQVRQQAGQQQQQQMQMAMAAANNQAMRGDKGMQGKVNGQGILRLLQFTHHLSNSRTSAEDFTNDIGYWQNFVSRFFAEGVGTFNYTLLENEGNTKRFEIAYAALPRFFYTQFAGDVQAMEFVVNEPSESGVPMSSGESYVQSGNAKLIYWFINGTQLVCQGKLQVLFEGSQIQALEFVTSSQQEFIPMDKMKELFAQNSPTQITKQSPKLVKNQAKRQNQNRQQQQEATIVLSDIPKAPVTGLGVTSRVQTYLEVGETIFNMTDLINHYVSNPNQTPSQALQDVVRQPQQNMQMMQQMPNMHPGLGGHVPPGAQGQQFMSPHLQQRGIPGMVGSPAGMHTPSPNAHILAQQQGTNSSTASANTSPNVNNKRRRPSAVKEEPDGGGDQKVKQSPRVGGNKRLKQQ